MREFDNPAYRPLAPHAPADPWDTSASARADLMRQSARLAERDRAERLMPDDEQEDAEPSYPPRTGGGACAGVLFAALVLAVAASGAWALFGPWLGGGGR